jgi:hypothetical protein
MVPIIEISVLVSISPERSSMRHFASAASAVAAGAAAVAMLSFPATALAASPQDANERPPAASSAFQQALAEGTSVGTQDYCEPGANDPGRCD